MEGGKAIGVKYQEKGECGEVMLSSKSVQRCVVIRLE
jgi:hypothetical protein